MSDGEKLNVTVWLNQTFSEIIYEDIIKNNTMSEISGISSSGPSLPRVVQFVMGIDILSINNRGIDYTIELTSPLETNKPFWTQNIYEISTYGNKKIVHTQTFDTFPYNDKKFIEFSIDLKSIGYPDKYKLLFYIVDVSPLDGKYCRIVDTSNWTLIPPPSFSIFVNPNNVVMRPPEDKNIYVNIVSDSELESKGILSTSFPDTENIDLRFIANETTISPFINNSAIMHISTKEVPYLTEPMKIPIKIFANISFPPTITNRGGDTYYNNKSISFVEVSNLTLTILPPYTINEQLENLSKSIQPIGELWGVFTTIGRGISGFIVFLYKRRKDKQEKQKRL